MIPIIGRSRVGLADASSLARFPGKKLERFPIKREEERGSWKPGVGKIDKNRERNLLNPQNLRRMKEFELKFPER